jgi:hypothetical protein
MPKSKLLNFLMPLLFSHMYVVEQGEGVLSIKNPALDLPDELIPDAWKQHVKDLRHEFKKLRETHSSHESEMTSAVDKAKKEVEDSWASKFNQAQTSSQERVIRSELKAAAIKAGMIDLDGLKLADLSKVTLKEDGEVDGAEVMLTELKAAKPYLFGVPNSSSNPTTPPNPRNPEAKKATEMTDAEYAAAKKDFLK